MEEKAKNKLQEKDITKLISTLNKREQEIIKRRFGIDNEEPKTLEQIGNKLYNNCIFIKSLIPR